MEDVLTPPPQPELAGEKRKREESSLDASIEDAPSAPASTCSAEDAAGSDVARHPMWKTSLCSFFRRRGAGAEGCSHGDSCRYAHTEEELRPRPDGTWDPTSDRAKELRKVAAEAQEEAEEEVTVDEQSLDKCLVGLPRGWTADRLKSLLQDQAISTNAQLILVLGFIGQCLGISYATAKKKKGMTVGFVTFQSVEQLTNAVQVLKENPSDGKQIKIVDANRRSHQKAHAGAPVSNTGTATENGSSPTTPAEETSVPESVSSSKKGARDAVTPLAHMTYIDQLEHKKQSMAQILKKLTRNARKACPPTIPHPDWVFKSKEIGGLPCKFEGILESPVVNGYRNKCEFSVGYSLEGKKTVGFMLGNFRLISLSHFFTAFNSINNNWFVREDVQLKLLFHRMQNHKYQKSCLLCRLFRVCSTSVDEALMKEEFDKLSAALVQGAATCSPPLPLTTIVVQVVGIEMNESAVSDAHRNALINGIKNCRFVCGKAEDVMGPLLTEYLGSPQQQAAASKSNSEIDDTSKTEDMIGCASYDGENIDSSKQRHDNAEGQQPMDTSVDHPTCASEVDGMDVVDCNHDENNVASGEQNCGEASLINGKPIETSSDNSLEQGKTCKDGSSSPNNNVLAANACQFKNVIKALRTHPRIRRLVYISCNPDSLVANGIELCTPTPEKQEKNKGNRGWRSMSSAGLARQRTKSMPNSEPFIPKRAMAVDLFPHTPHCEMVMLFER
ncbi:Zinc finger CCCH domain-containing protein 24 [Zea mays]|uniref:Zinc finger CCCH domain-containing protein 24 n=1 Tax=Zea mays TaxID=4577 RepID=A0A1D6EFY5_MAIZE|nr:Zinc finger CCCH domain-containing protein 24 [Zea mays]